MSRFLFVPILALPLSLPLPAAELIPMNIKRIDRDHYQTTDD